MATGLNVWMNGDFVGRWYTKRSGTPTFRYTESWVQSPRARALSLSLPITAGDREIRGDTVTNYFDNLLPDSQQIRVRIRSRFNTRSTSAFDLLTAIGRDCVGAVQLLSPGMEPDGWNRIDADRLTDEQIEHLLRGVTSGAPLGRPEDVDGEYRISIAGAQEKTALLRMGGHWYQPRGATPTTHILKLPLGMVGHMQADMKDSVENEWLCGQILREFGFAVAESEMATFGAQRVLIVSRFDRRCMGANTEAAEKPDFRPRPGVWIARLPQEDFCQASGLPPDKKYESDGGPSMRACIELLSASESADSDRSQFVLLQLVFWLLAATDGHAKNFSIYHGPGGLFRMTPAYDVISAWPIIGNGPNQLQFKKATLAMAVRVHNAHYKIQEIQTRHWKHLADTCGLAEVWDQMLNMISKVDAVLERVANLLPSDFPASTWEPIYVGVRRQATAFMRGQGQL